MKFSIVIPARDESAYIGACFDSIERAARNCEGEVETIVVLNRCTDSTADIAVSAGAKTVQDDRKNLAMIRNSGARQACGDILITVDADSTMSSNMLHEIDKALQSGRYIGGGVPIRPERFSLGIFLSGVLLMATLPLGISAGLFWCRREDFNAVGGFDENVVIAEDIDFAKRLKAHGKRNNKKFGTLRKTYITTSCRKFDKYGDWFLVKQPWLIRRALSGTDKELADRIFYDFER
jgi:glycosyltransferase involved in cell wall biosynthesis